MLLKDSITADFRHLLKGKILEDLTSRHTGGGDWMFSLKRQEEKGEDRTGRMGGGAGNHRAGRYLGYKEHDGAPAF